MATGNTLKVVLIGTGNVAYHLAKILPHCNCDIIQVFSRTEAHAKALAELTSTCYITDITQVDRNADVYLYALTDTALPLVAASMPHTNGLHLHTSGTVPMSVFADYQSHYGVLYPLQSFSKDAEVNWAEVPIFTEGNSDTALQQVQALAQRITPLVQVADTETRKTIHLAGVLTNNFSNALYNIAHELLKEKGVDFRLFLPLLKGSIGKLNTLTPHQAQTGPAVRGDNAIINAHCAMLEQHPRWQEIYRLLTEEIRETHG